MYVPTGNVGTKAKNSGTSVMILKIFLPKFGKTFGGFRS
jgi:hypothetical protein